MPNVRIKDQTTDTALTTGDYVIVDSESEGTRKYDLGALAERVEALEQGGAGLTETEKQLILTLFSKAAYAESDAGSAYDALENLWTTTTRTITYNLSHVSSSNTTASVESGQSYTTTLTATGSYTLNTVTVTMGGVDITSTAYSSGTVSIPSVTGNIVITATAVLAAQSITATYTQSGTVYDTATLDSLKADLVVTANYSGGTSETVPSSDYTLSGTLAEGTSTITVNYAGLTDTFTVTVTEAPYDTTPDVTDYDKRLTNSGALANQEGLCVTDFYEITDSSIFIYNYYVGDTSPYSVANLLIYDSNNTALGHYNSGNPAGRSLDFSTYPATTKFRVSLYTTGLENCYCYETNTGKVLFAGVNSQYYGKHNISEVS